MTHFFTLLVLLSGLLSGRARGADTVNEAFIQAAASAPGRQAPAWRSSYPAMQPVSLSELLPDGPDASLQLGGLQLAADRSVAYLDGQASDRSTRVGGQQISIAATRAALVQLGLDIGSDGTLTLAELEAGFQAYRTRPAKDLGKATGYFEPVVSARLTRSEAYDWPIYPRPTGLAKPDDTREQIMFGNSLAGRSEPIAFLPTAVDVSVLQIQGSAVLDLGDGTIGRVNYAAANGHPYRAIANAMLDVIPVREMSMEAIKTYLYAHPERWREVLSYDRSYVFMRPVAHGPIGTIQQVVTAERSIAVDARRVPLGSLCLIRIPSLGISRLVLAQDTGGAIKGPGRFDYFRGTGPAGALRASAMNEGAELYVLLPRATP
jgi:membrane-bound lytic murein transglycosylase A